MPSRKPKSRFCADCQSVILGIPYKLMGQQKWFHKYHHPAYKKPEEPMMRQPPQLQARRV